MTLDERIEAGAKAAWAFRVGHAKSAGVVLEPFGATFGDTTVERANGVFDEVRYVLMKAVPELFAALPTAPAHFKTETPE